MFHCIERVLRNPVDDKAIRLGVEGLLADLNVRLGKPEVTLRRLRPVHCLNRKLEVIDLRTDLVNAIIFDCVHHSE